MEEQSVRKRKGGFQALRSLPVFFLPIVYVYERECLRDFELFLRGSLSQPNILCVGFTAALSHPPLCCSDWLRDIGEREKKRESVRHCYSLSTLTHCEAKSERPARMRERECVHSTYSSHTGTLFSVDPAKPLLSSSPQDLC